MKGLRDSVQDFVSLGVLPSEGSEVDDELFERRQRQLERIAAEVATSPLLIQEAIALASCFGRDGCFGLSWTLLHLVESCREFQPAEEPAAGNEWRRQLWERSERLERAGDRVV